MKDAKPLQPPQLIPVDFVSYYEFSSLPCRPGRQALAPYDPLCESPNISLVLPS